MDVALVVSEGPRLIEKYVSLRTDAAGRLLLCRERAGRFGSAASTPGRRSRWAAPPRRRRPRSGPRAKGRPRSRFFIVERARTHAVRWVVPSGTEVAVGDEVVVDRRAAFRDPDPRNSPGRSWCQAPNENAMRSRWSSQGNSASPAPASSRHRLLVAYRGAARRAVARRPPRETVPDLPPGVTASSKSDNDHGRPVHDDPRLQRRPRSPKGPPTEPHASVPARLWRPGPRSPLRAWPRPWPSPPWWRCPPTPPPGGADCCAF